MGRVYQLNVKPGVPGEVGLPKASVPEVRVGAGGVEGDHNHYRHEQLADELDSAVMLLPIETIHGLGREGWPMSAGDLGENVTTQGVAYDAMTPGTRVRIGTAVVQITRPCEPCTSLYRLPYVGEARGPAFLKTMLGRRGWYARVARAGVVRVGDRVEVEDAGPPTRGD